MRGQSPEAEEQKGYNQVGEKGLMWAMQRDKVSLSRVGNHTLPPGL